jgi:hypothetical protein
MQEGIMKPITYQIEITQQDIDEAVAERVGHFGNYDICQHCLISRVLQRFFRNHDISTAVQTVFYRDEKVGSLDEWAFSMMISFDTQNYEQLKPRTITVTAIHPELLDYRTDTQKAENRIPNHEERNTL